MSQETSLHAQPRDSFTSVWLEQASVLYDKDGNEVPVINQNVLIEIGVARAWYTRKFILLVEDGVSLPSNLQGLYECRYSGDGLDMEATFKLLEAFSDFRAS